MTFNTSGWRLFPPQHRCVDKGHGRLEERWIWTSAALNDYVEFPYCRQVFRIERWRRRSDGTPLSHEVVFGLTSLPSTQTTPARLLDLHRGHWSIENRLHWVRDMSFDEDRSRLRRGASAHAMASLRNLAIGILRRAGASNIAAALRHCAARVRTALRLIGLA